MQNVVRQTSQARQLRRLVEIAGQRNDPMCTQQFMALRRMRQGIQTVAPAQQSHRAQSYIPTADDQKSSHPAILVELEVDPAASSAGTYGCLFG